MTREEAIKVLNMVEAYGLADEAKRVAIEALQAEPKHGEWIDVVNEPYCECSVCGIYIHNLDDDYKFCPRCGAKMDNEGISNENKRNNAILECRAVDPEMY